MITTKGEKPSNLLAFCYALILQLIFYSARMIERQLNVYLSIYMVETLFKSL